MAGLINAASALEEIVLAARILCNPTDFAELQRARRVKSVGIKLEGKRG